MSDNSETDCNCLQELKDAIDWMKRDLVDKNFTGPQILDLISRAIGAAIRGDSIG